MKISQQRRPLTEKSTYHKKKRHFWAKTIPQNKSQITEQRIHLRKKKNLQNEPKLNNPKQVKTV